MKTAQKVSIVCPCFNEREVLPKFYDRLKKALDTCGSQKSIEFEVLFIDDGSTDGTLAILDGLARSDSSVKVFSLSRNFGHQVALSAGLDQVAGAACILMDSDLQHPPELIPKLIEEWQKGCDIVRTIRHSSESESRRKRLLSALYYRVMSRISGTPIVAGAADFVLLSRRVYTALRHMPERHRFLRGMVSWMGYESRFVEFDAPIRQAGRTKYSLARMLSFAMDGVFSFSLTPIRLAWKAGAGFILLGSGLMLYSGVWMFFIDDYRNAKWIMLLGGIFFLSGLHLAWLGVVGEYVARIYDQVRERPLYLFKQAPEDSQMGRATSILPSLQARTY